MPFLDFMIALLLVRGVGNVSVFTGVDTTVTSCCSRDRRLCIDGGSTVSELGGVECDAEGTLVSSVVVFFEGDDFSIGRMLGEDGDRTCCNGAEGERLRIRLCEGGPFAEVITCGVVGDGCTDAVTFGVVVVASL